MDRLRAAAEDDGVPRLQTEGGRVRRDVRAGFVDDADDPERDAHPADEEAVRPPPHGRDLADGIGQGGHLGEPLGDPRDGRLRKRQAVDHCRGEAEIPRVGEILFVFPDQAIPAPDEGVRHRD